MSAEQDSRLPEPSRWSDPLPEERQMAALPRFSNDAIDPGLLPEFQRASLHPVSPRFVYYAVTANVVSWAVVIALVIAVPRLPMVNFELPAWLPLVPLALMLWSCLVGALDANRRRWVLREHDLIYRSGLIWQRTAILPFARIQHVETASGPIERLFGLMRVKCFTAGGMSADLTVEGLERDAARRVRQYLLEQISDEDTAARATAEADAE